MRNLNVLVAMLALLLVFGLVFVSCDNGTTGGGGEEPGFDGTVVPGANLAEKLAWLQANAENGGIYLIELVSDENTGPITLNYSGRTDVTIGLRGLGENRTVSLSSNGRMFTVDSGFTLVLDNNITLKGRDGNSYGGLVMVSVGGTLVMNEGSAISGNKTSGQTGGVGVSGTFTMNGGTITGNAAHDGGGVTVGSAGIFTMRGGSITGNIAQNNGGGLQAYGGTFIMRGGSISNNSANAGGGMWVVSSGTFTMSGGSITGNTATIVGGGVLVGSSDGNFTKTGGTITGSDANNGNAAYAGSAVYVFTSNNTGKSKETTSGPRDNLSYNASDGTFTGVWDS